MRSGNPRTISCRRIVVVGDEGALNVIRSSGVTVRRVAPNRIHLPRRVVFELVVRTVRESDLVQNGYAGVIANCCNAGESRSEALRFPTESRPRVRLPIPALGN